MLYREIIAVCSQIHIKRQFLTVGLVVHKVTTGLRANQLNLLNGAIRNSGRKPNKLAGAVPTFCVRTSTTELHTCRHIVSMCVTVNKNGSFARVSR